MHSTVVIKGSQAGMTVILDPDVPFEKLLEDIAKKFKDSARFWGAVQITLTLEGRRLTPREELAVVQAITDNSQIEILCLLDTDANRIARCEKALTERLMELSSQTGQFYKGDLKRGDVLESEASIVVIGDVNHGARVIAKGEYCHPGFPARKCLRRSCRKCFCSSYGYGDGSNAGEDRRFFHPPGR